MKTFRMAGKALAFLLVMTLLCGVVYPMVTTGLAQLFLNKQANGDLIVIDGVKPERLERFRSVLDAYKPEAQSMKFIQ